MEVPVPVLDGGNADSYPCFDQLRDSLQGVAETAGGIRGPVGGEVGDVLQARQVVAGRERVEGGHRGGGVHRCVQRAQRRGECRRPLLADEGEGAHLPQRRHRRRTDEARRQYRVADLDRREGVAIAEHREGPVQPPARKGSSRCGLAEVSLRLEVTQRRVRDPDGVDDGELLRLPPGHEGLHGRVQAEEAVDLEGILLRHGERGTGGLVMGVAERGNGRHPVEPAVEEHDDQHLRCARGVVRAGGPERQADLGRCSPVARARRPVLSSTCRYPTDQRREQLATGELAHRTAK